MVTAMIICNQHEHGYHIGADMDPDTDCSGLIGYALSKNGFNVPRRWNTTSMIPTLSNYQGFTHYIWSPSFQWRNGDIAVYDEGGGRFGHTFFYATNVVGYTATSDSNTPGTASADRAMLPQARIEASSSRGVYIPGTETPLPGNQPNQYGAYTEVWTHAFAFDPDGHTWHIFRWHADDPTPPDPPSPSGNIYPYWLLKKLKERSFGAII